MQDQRKKVRKEDIRKQKRVERMKEITLQRQAEGYERKDVTISIVYANVMAIVLSIPFILLFGGWYLVRNGFSVGMSYIEILMLTPVMILLVVVHELIHGLTWGLLAPSRFRSIEFGIMQEMLTPYCTCGEPLSKWGYILGTIMPAIVLGFIPCVIAVLVASAFWLFMGIIMIMSAGGDFMVIIKMLTYKTDASEIIIMDHPSEAGFIVFER